MDVMKKTKIWIYTKHTDFGEALALYISQQNDPDLQVEFFKYRPTQGGLEEEMQEHAHPLEEGVVLLTDDREYFKELSGKKFYLSPYPTSKPEEIFMYQNRKALLEEVRQKVLPEIVREMKEGQTEVYCVFSLENGEAATEYALSIMRTMRKQGKKILYVPMTPYPLREELWEKSEVLTIPDLVMEGNPHLQSEVVQDGEIFRLRPALHHKDYLDLKKEEVIRFMKNLHGQTFVDLVVVEVGVVFEYSLDVLKQGDVVIAPLKESWLNQMKKEEFERQCARLDDGDLTIRWESESLPAITTREEYRRVFEDSKKG